MSILQHEPLLTESGRHNVLARLVPALIEAGGALQGHRDAATVWVGRTDLADLDLWVPVRGLTALATVIDDLGGISLVTDDRPGRLQHHQWWIPGGPRGAIVDVTVGDLRVGPVLLCPEAEMTSELTGELTGEHALAATPMLTGAGAVADLAVRPLLRGRVPEPHRLDAARRHWSELPADIRSRVTALFDRQLGHRASSAIVSLLEGGTSTGLPQLLRRRLALASLRPSQLTNTWHARHTITASRNGPFGVPARGVVVALVGTDGSGKSTISTHLAEQLQPLGFTVRHEYFGMARGNLPGVGIVRRLVRGSDQQAIAARPERSSMTTDHSSAQTLLRRLGAWLYAADYTWRSLRRVRPAVRRREIVVCDRWVTDLRRQPWPNSPAAAVAERLVGAPDVLALAWAPSEVIHARKAERTLDDTRAEQEALHSVLDDYRRPGTTALLIDTTIALPTLGESAPADHPLSSLVRAVLCAAHRSN